LGHEDRFPPSGLSGGCGFTEETLVDTRGEKESAPITAIRGDASESAEAILADNAARVVARGAGIRIGKEASPERIAAAIERVLTNPQYRTAARRLGTSILNDGDPALNAVEAIERLPATTSNETVT